MGLRENILQEPISEIELRELIALPGRTPVRRAVELMREKKLGCAIVVDDAGRAIGKFTERLLLKLLLSDPKGLDEPVERFMYRSADALRRDRPIVELVELMKSQGLRFVCAVDDEGRPVALTGQKGLMEYLAEHFPRQVKAQLLEPKLYMDQREGA